MMQGQETSMTSIEKIIGGLVIIRNELRELCPICNECDRVNYCTTRRILLRNLSICISRCWKTHNYNASERLSKIFDSSLDLNSSRLTVADDLPERRRLFTSQSSHAPDAPDYNWPVDDVTDTYV